MASNGSLAAQIGRVPSNASKLPDGGSEPSESPRKDGVATGSDADAGPVRRGGGRPPTHSLTKLRKTLTELGTAKLDGRSRVAVAARRFKADLLADLGGNPSRAQETLCELAARQWVLVCILDDFIQRQSSIVTRKRQVIPVLMQRQTIADGLVRYLTALGLERRLAPASDLAAYLRAKASGGGSS